MYSNENCAVLRSVNGKEYLEGDVHEGIVGGGLGLAALAGDLGAGEAAKDLRDPRLLVQLLRREAKHDRNAPLLLFRETIRIDSGEPGDE